MESGGRVSVMPTPTIRIVPFHRFSSLVKNGRRYKRFYFRLVASNGEIVAQSESYNTARARNKTAALLARAKMVVGK